MRGKIRAVKGHTKIEWVIGNKEACPSNLGNPFSGLPSHITLISTKEHKQTIYPVNKT